MDKRWICLLLCVALLLGCLVGCGKDEDAAVQDADTPATEAPVETQPQVVEFAKERIVLISEGEEWVLYDGDVAHEEITYVSDNPAVATFENGVVTAVSSGETVVHAQHGGKQVSCTVICNLRFFGEPSAEPTDPDDNGGPYGVDPRDPVMAPPAQAKVDSAFFDDAVFIGDSVTLKLSYYAASSGKLGKAQFLTRGSYSASHAVEDTMLLTYQGQDLSIADAVSATGATKVFLMLGMNDIGLYGIDKTIENWGVIVERIQTKCPNVTIYVQSMTPIWTGGEVGDLTNANMDVYNEELKAFAENAGLDFIDVAPYMKDSTGGMATRYCSDNFVHVTDIGAAAWIRVLKAYDYV